MGPFVRFLYFICSGSGRNCYHKCIAYTCTFSQSWQNSVYSELIGNNFAYFNIHWRSWKHGDEKNMVLLFRK